MKLSKKDVNNKVQSYLTKMEEYDNMELPELIELRDSGKVKGTYLEVLTMMIKLKSKQSA